jgi:mRNA (guanine-N7-)-methyltransferase
MPKRKPYEYDDERRESSKRVRQHYNSQRNKTYKHRETSRVVHLRKLNNWIKTCLIDKYIYKSEAGATVLDMCCGKGGDLSKYRHHSIKMLVAADFAKHSIEDAKQRYTYYKIPFKAIFSCIDLHSSHLSDVLPSDIHFDLVSCHFSLHYAFDTEAHARCMLENATERMRDGGYFIGTIPDYEVLRRCKKTFRNQICTIRSSEDDTPRDFGEEYVFDLLDSVAYCSEYVVDMNVLERLAFEYGLKLERSENFHDFYHTFKRHKRYNNLLYQMDVRGLSEEEWDVAGFYRTFVFSFHNEDTNSD